MAKTKPIPTCDFEGCRNDNRSVGTFVNGKNRYDKFCSSHRTKVTIGRFLGRLYSGMKERVAGKSTKRPDLYLGLPILPKDVFMNWAKNHPDFLRIYKRWFTSDFDRTLTPCVNRMNSSKGYTLNNMEWMTNSQNCGLSSGVRSMKRKKAIYDLLGVNK